MIALLFTTQIGKAQDLLYSNDFESGLNGATIYGSGDLVEADDSRFGTVFHNAIGGEALRANYLLLPNTIFADLQNSGKNELTISFWLNKGTADTYFWSPIFSAYGSGPNVENSWPMLILQARLVAQANIAGWTDFTVAQNDSPVYNDEGNLDNLQSTVWFEDGEWHHYAAVFTQTTLKIYVDGTILQSWTLNDDSNGGKFSGIYTNGSELTYIALGGNQAWNWGDVDPAFMYDDLAIYSSSLTKEQIDNIIDVKLNGNSVGIEKNEVVKVVSETQYYSISGQKVSDNFDLLPAGVYIKSVKYIDGSVENTKVIKQ